MRTLIQLTLFAVILSLLACQSKEEPVTRESRLSKGHQLIDQSQWDEAIEYLTKLEQQDPHLHVRLALASAYAGRAGVRIEKIYSFVAVRNLKPQTVSLNAARMDQKTQELMQSLGRYAAQWEKIPEVRASGREDLTRALQVLAEQPEAGARLYAATLRVVLLKSVVNEGLLNWQVVRTQKICSDVVQPYYDWALQLLEHLILISQDLTSAFPGKKAEFSSHTEDLQRFKKEAEGVPWPQEKICF
ncbi:hypothetical protein Bb109J_c2552 [Bdellovibrio bacteriovorus]|uniref:hypothetical protein n=1 Tax=Bdellovibrio bacteriovorus TaxID=959 RepID=UPI00045BF689|nr:hypothetical protein [Bdellovibrio bacteriovorus]AHZ85239.1 hypothetical protein EP01_09855 [Bdellovibrio bacteriovorus]BEV69132.1 hypothetical protein Bb109J_c2552 [Bdellovibrio bacteriovorus]